MTSTEKRRFIFTLITAAFIIFIFSNSLQNADNSGAKSSKVVEILTSLSSSVGLHIPVSEYFIRKAGHFTEFMILGMLLLGTLRTYTKKLLQNIFAPLFFGLATAVSDESIQLFVQGRSSQVSDVVLDFCGMVTGLLMLGLIMKIHTVKKQGK